MPPLRRIVIASVAALSLGLTAVVLMRGFSPSGPLRALETLACVVVGASVLGSLMFAAGHRLAGWSDPESEEDFERVVLRAERLAREGTAAEPTRPY